VSTQITQSFDEPYFGGGLTSNTAANIGGSLVAINGKIYPIDTASNRYAQRSIDVLQQRNTTDQRDLLLLPQNVWRQQTSAWHSGAGQSNMDRDTSIQSRFEDSFGIDPWTKWRFSLLPDVEQVQEISNSDGVFLTQHGGYLVVVNENYSYWYEDFDTLTASVAMGPDTIIDVADDGATVLALNDSGYIYTLDSPTGTATQYYNQVLADANFIAWEKDYLLCGNGNVLESIETGNNKTTIFTHPETDFRWNSACSGPQAIYLLGGIGDKYIVHKVTIKDDGTGLNPCIVAAKLPDGEIGYKIEEYLGFIFIGTNKGVRMAQPDANGDLTLGAIIPTSEPVRCFEGQGQFVWYGVSSMDPGYTPVQNDQANVFPTSPVPGLGRMDLTTFTVTNLTPAYANDVAVWDLAAANVTSVRTFLDKRVFAVQGGGIYREIDQRVPAGWLTQGTMSFSVEDLKSALYMQAKWIPDCSGKLYIDMSFDSSLYGRYARLTVNNENIRSDNINLYGTKFSRVNVRFVMTRCHIDPTKGPIPTRWELRAFPVKGKASRWDVPVILADEVDINGISEVRNPTADKNALLGLIEQGTVFQYQESGQSYQVLARDFVWQPERLSTTGNGWQGTLLMVLEEVM